MRVLLLEPASAAVGRGNATTAERYARAAEGAGHCVLRATPDTIPTEAVDLVHAHHAARCGPRGVALAQQWRCPLIISLGGTDLHGQAAQGLDPTARAPLQYARLILGPFADDASLLRAAGIDTSTFRVVRRGVKPVDALPHQPALGVLRILCLGAVRPLKNNMVAMEIVAALRRHRIDCTLTFAGAELDSAYAEGLRQRLHASDVMLGPVASAALPAIFASSDVLLNTSLAEGASNAILEALAAGVPVAASNVHGNTALLRTAGANFACLFDLAEPLTQFAPFGTLLLSAGTSENAERAHEAQEFVRVHHDVAAEAHELLGAYAEALGATPQAR